jgi:hypothetical protein
LLYGGQLRFASRLEPQKVTVEHQFTDQLIALSDYYRKRSWMRRLRRSFDLNTSFAGLRFVVAGMEERGSARAFSKLHSTHLVVRHPLLLVGVAGAVGVGTVLLVAVVVPT